LFEAAFLNIQQYVQVKGEKTENSL